MLPIVAAYGKYYGWAFALRITALMLVSMILAALVVDALFGAVGLIPGGARPSRDDVFGSVRLDYKLVFNVLGTLIFAALFYLTIRRGATDPVCGMKVDRRKALSKEVGGRTHYFCSEQLHARVRGRWRPPRRAVTRPLLGWTAGPGTGP